MLKSKYIKIARKNNLYFKNKVTREFCDEIMKPFIYLNKGGEGFIYKHPSKDICRKVFYNYKFFDCIKDVLIHNKIFNNKIEIIGCIKHGFKYNWIIESPYINGELPTFIQIRKSLLDNGFIVKNKILFNTKEKVYIIDINTRNFLKRENIIYPLDVHFYGELLYSIILFLLRIRNWRMKYAKNKTEKNKTEKNERF